MLEKTPLWPTARRWFTALVLTALAAVSPEIGRAAPEAPEGYGLLLARHVHDGVVDYAGLKKDEAVLDAALAQMAAVDPARLERPAAFAFYLNLYNAWTLKLILEHYPGLDSIKDIGPFWSSPWKLAIVALAGKTVSLDYLEQDVLRPTFADPRLHFAVNCASKSCPPLRAEPYEGRRLEAQLDDAARSFVNDRRQNAFEGDALVLSRIFDWYAKDFGGEAGVVAFIRSHADADLAARLDAAGRPRLRHRDYDWSLNGR